MAMRKTKNLALLLPVLPFLMATAALPSPTASIEKYSDIAISGTYLGPTGQINPNMYEYELDIENIGSENAILSLTYEYSTIYLTYDDFSGSPLFSKHLLAPGKHGKIMVKTDHSSIINDWSKYGITLYSYSIVDEGVSLKNLSFEKTKYSNGYYYYVLKGEIKNVSDFYYDFVFDVVYKGEEYSFSYNLHQNSISVREELDMDELEIKNVKAYRSSYQKAQETNGALVAFIFFVVLAFIIIIFVLLPGLISLIVIFSVKHKNKKIII